MADEETEQETEQEEESSEQEEPIEREAREESVEAKSGDDLARWKSESRKHESRAKANQKRADELERKLREYEDRDKSVHEKTVEEAFNRGRAEALTESQKERRRDRLELAVTRIAAATGVKVGDGDDVKTVKFADAELVQMWIERQLADGTLDAGDLFDDSGKVQTDALTDALVDLANDKPFLLATNGDRGRKPAGDPDAGKGKPSTGVRSVEEELAHIQRGRRPTATT